MDFGFCVVDWLDTDSGIHSCGSTVARGITLNLVQSPQRDLRFGINWFFVLALLFAIRVVDEEEPDNVIRNVLNSLQERNKTEENLEKIGKKSSKKSKKKHSLNIVEAQALSVEENNATQEESLPKDNDTSFTPIKEDTETDLKNSLVVADNSEDITPSKQILKENVDTGD